MVIIIVVLIFLLALFISFVFYSRVSGEYTYEGINGNVSFILDKHTGDEVHILDINATYRKDQGSLPVKKNFRIPFDYGPEELEPIYMEESKSIILNDRAVFITRDPYLDIKTEDKLLVAMMTVRRITGTDMLTTPIFNIPTAFGAIEESERATQLELSIVTCEESRDDLTVILFKEGTENKIYREGDYCIIAEYAEGDDPIKVGTKLTYHFLDVM